eukprot:6074263-Pyramimonas_sp.AAC.1
MRRGGLRPIVRGGSLAALAVSFGPPPSVPCTLLFGRALWCRHDTLFLEHELLLLVSRSLVEVGQRI